MKALNSVELSEFSELQLTQLKKIARNEGISVEALILEMTRRHLDKASGKRQIIRGRVLPFK